MYAYARCMSLINGMRYAIAIIMPHARKIPCNNNRGGYARSMPKGVGGKNCGLIDLYVH